MNAARLRLSWAMVLLVVAALEFVPSYTGALPAVVFAAAAIAPFLLVRLGILAKLGAAPSAIVVVVVVLGAGWWGLTRSGDTGASAYTDALPRLLTMRRPVPVEAALLTPPALLVALVAALVALCVLAPPAAGSARVGGIVAPALGAVVVYVAAQLLDAGAADRHGFVAVSLLAVIVVSWSTPYRRGTDRAHLGWSPATVVPAVAVIVVALAAAAAVPVHDAFDPRRHVSPPTVSLTEQSPLALLAGWARNPGVEILRATVSGTQRLRLATLSTFTGDTWAVDDSYTALDAAGSTDLPAGRRRAGVSADVTITRLGGLWVPAPGSPTATSLTGAVIDRDGAALARTQPVTAGLSYSVVAQVDAPSEAALRAAGLAGGVPARYLALPHLPSGFAQYARDSVRGASSPLEEAVALENAVSTGRRLSPSAPTGSTYARLATFLFGHGRIGAQAGTSEQFAASFAVLARAVGLPSRVVVGFVVPAAGADGRSVVRGANAEAWPEVYLAGAGWVPFEPTPGASGASGDAGLKQSVLKRLKGNAAVVTAPPRQPVTAPPSAPARAASAPAHGSPVPAGAIALLVLAVLLALLALLAALRVARTARHRRAGARGAWAEVLDLFVLLGRPAPAHLPAPELAADLDRHLDHPGAARAVAAAADRAAFAPDGADAHAPEVWRQVRVLRRRSRTRLRWYRRAGFAVDPRPLLRRH